MQLSEENLELMRSVQVNIFKNKLDDNFITAIGIPNEFKDQSIISLLATLCEWITYLLTVLKPNVSEQDRNEEVEWCLTHIVRWAIWTDYKNAPYLKDAVIKRLFTNKNPKDA